MRNKLMLNADGKPSEAREQMTFFSYVNMKAGTDDKYKMIFAVANGGSRHKLEAINLKRQGVLAGVPDIFVDVPVGKYHGLRIEMKVGKNKPTDKQKEMIERYNKMGYKAAVCYGAAAAIETLEDYLKGE